MGYWGRTAIILGSVVVADVPEVVVHVAICRVGLDTRATRVVVSKDSGDGSLIRR